MRIGRETSGLDCWNSDLEDKVALFKIVFQSDSTTPQSRHIIKF